MASVNDRCATGLLVVDTGKTALVNHRHAVLRFPRAPGGFREAFGQRRLESLPKSLGLPRVLAVVRNAA
jgi:hypothetical protein